MRAIVVVGVVLALLGLTKEPMTAQTNTETPSAAAERAKIDLNEADQTALEELPGVGPRTAELILEYRSEHGGFKKIEELMNVRGIGERTFLRLRELVRVSVPAEKP